MKFSKPLYDSDKKIYTSEVKDGFRYEADQEDSILTPTLESIYSSISSVSTAEVLIQATKSWFTKPLTVDWLLSRIVCQLSTPPTDFEGKCIWIFKRLLITKDKFYLEFDLETLSAERICIEFPEPEPEPPASSPPLPQESSASSVQTRRELEKSLVVAARIKAAKALFKAERLTQAYVKTYGETDWEDEIEEDSEP